MLAGDDLQALLGADDGLALRPLSSPSNEREVVAGSSIGILFYDIVHCVNLNVGKQTYLLACFHKHRKRSQARRKNFPLRYSRTGSA